MHKYSECTLLAIVGVVFSPMNCNRDKSQSSKNSCISWAIILAIQNF